MGAKLDADAIKEGDDVYFECHIQANPKPYKMAWYHNVSPSAPPLSFWSVTWIHLLNMLIPGPRAEPQRVAGRHPVGPVAGAAECDQEVCRGLYMPGRERAGPPDEQRGDTPSAM